MWRESHGVMLAPLKFQDDGRPRRRGAGAVTQYVGPRNGLGTNGAAGNAGQCSAGAPEKPPGCDPGKNRHAIAGIAEIAER